MYRGVLHGKAVWWNQVSEDCIEGCKEKQRRAKKATPGASSSELSMKTDGLLPSQEGRVHIYKYPFFFLFLVWFL